MASWKFVALPVTLPVFSGHNLRLFFLNNDTYPFGDMNIHVSLFGQHPDEAHTQPHRCIHLY